MILNYIISLFNLYRGNGDRIIEVENGCNLIVNNNGKIGIVLDEAIIDRQIEAASKIDIIKKGRCNSTQCINNHNIKVESVDNRTDYVTYSIMDMII